MTDYIIVGAGPAGCVLANRLSEDPSNSVLLLEAGGKDWHPYIHMPAGFAKMTKGIASWGWSTVPQKHMNDRVFWYTQAKVVGGGSSINAQIYTRGNARDYDAWEKEEGLAGWGYRDVLPYFKRAENNQRYANDFHGDQGPLGVSLLRKGEAEGVMETFVGKFDMQVIKIDAQERFLGKLKGVDDPEQKRKIIGNEFIYVFQEESDKLADYEFLAQGTLYTDIVESGTATAQTIKSHHNVGGLPEDIKFKLIEPLKALFKDEVRKVGEECGLPEAIVWRQPFPGPGLAIRVLGEVTEEKLHIVRESDAILRDEIAKAGLDREIWQYFTALPNMKSVGVMGDARTYSYTVGIRAVTSIDGMTADWARIPWDILEKISVRIVNEVDNVNRIVYDVTSKPPATIEWE